MIKNVFPKLTNLFYGLQFKNDHMNKIQMKSNENLKQMKRNAIKCEINEPLNTERQILDKSVAA